MFNATFKNILVMSYRSVIGRRQ